MKKDFVQATTVDEAGRKGGLTTLRLYGLGHFQLAGKKGQAALAARCTSAQRRAWGLMGGRPRKHRYQDTEEKRQ